MKNINPNCVKDFLLLRKEQIRHGTIIAALLLFISLALTAALIRPASTLESTCDIAEHSHNDDCYKTELVCTDVDPEHSHGDACFESVLICEIMEHTHGTDCVGSNSDDDGDDDGDTDTDSNVDTDTGGNTDTDNNVDTDTGGNTDNNVDTDTDENSANDEQNAAPLTLTPLAMPTAVAAISDVPVAVSVIKDNSDNLETVDGADTADFIELNLYNYGDNINDLWKKDNNYPGFQQDKGTLYLTNSSKFLGTGFNFGNNITVDLKAGEANVTRLDGAINKIDETYGAANAPITGAMLGELKNGYPALSNGDSLDYLFKDGAYAKKQNSNSINGLFRYDEATGSYSFNSRENHAQFNQKNDTFTLYKQLITSNFMMYPFGNFLPFNDIITTTAQASTINRDYLCGICKAAEEKYNEDQNAEYLTLAENLNRFIELMDEAYKNKDGGWTAADCANEYFKLCAIPSSDNPKTFSERSLADIYSIDYDVATDFFFGMEMKTTIIQPNGGLTGPDGDQPMVFYFTGDDDVWVYLDDTLFLDLSGIHRHVGGEIDFVNGLVNYYNLDVTTGDVAKKAYKTVKFSDLVDESKLNSKGTFIDYTQHSFNFYYMERGAGSGVCRMNFNFPMLKKNSISVSKEISVGDGENTNLLGNPDYYFQLVQPNGTDLFIGKDVNYDVLDKAGNYLDTYTTDKFGIFAIKAEQTAVFSDISEDDGSFFARELFGEESANQYKNVTIDGSKAATKGSLILGEKTYTTWASPTKNIADGNTVFSVNNSVDGDYLGSLAITKELAQEAEDNTKVRAASEFAFYVSLDGTPLPKGSSYKVGSRTKTVATDGIVSVKPGETATIDGILAGTEYFVCETAESAFGYAVKYSIDGGAEQDLPNGVTGSIGGATTVAIKAINKEAGAGVTIPFSKLLANPDGAEHRYTVCLQEVTDVSGSDFATDSLPQRAEITVSTEQALGSFNLSYTTAELSSYQELPKTIYYKLWEEADPNDTTCNYDENSFVVEVVICQGATGYVAELGSVYIDSTPLDDSAICFCNSLIGYELPETGGIGTTYLYTAGLFLIGAGILLLIRGRRQNNKATN